MANLYLFYDRRKPRQDGSGTLKIALTHKRITAYRSLDIHIRESEWDAAKAQVIGRPDKKFLNIEARKMLAKCVTGLERMQKRQDFDTFTASTLLEVIMRGADTVDEPESLDYVLPVYNEYIALCRKASTTQTYKTSLNNLIEFCEDIDTLRFKDITGIWLRKYQNWLLDERGMEVNGANVYLRNLRTIFNFALANQMTSARYPFKDIDMSTTEPDKRMIPYEKFLEWATRPMPDNRNFYRDLFMLSFYLCGIRPVDLLHVKKSQVQEGRLVYHPEKLNGRTKLSVKIEPEAWEIIHRYEGKEYLLNIMESRADYKTFMKYWNKALRAIGDDVLGDKKGSYGRTYHTITHKGIVPYITIYYARTCWATYSYNVLDTPMDIISQALGHKSGLRVTNFYVRREVGKVDKANRDLIDRVTKDMKEFAASKKK